MADSTPSQTAPATPPPGTVTTGSDPRFQYQQIKPPPIPLDIYDDAARAVLDPKAGSMPWFGYIVVMFRATFFWVWLAGRKMLIEQMMLAAKQTYEGQQNKADQTAIDQDNLDGVKK